MSDVWEVAGLKAAPGSFVQGMVDLPGVSSRIPLFLLNGRADGPMTVILGGVHGCEYTSIDAAIQLVDRFKQLEALGRVAIVPVVSMDAYSARSLYVHPTDRKNLNRICPGNEHGTETERLAFQLFQTFLRPCDILIDLHGGDMCESLVPHIYWYQTPDPVLNEKARRFAQYFGIPYIYRSRALGSVYQSAAGAGNISVLAEAGQHGILYPALATMLLDGCLNALRSVGVLPGTPFEPSGQVDIEKSWWPESDQFGAWYPAVKAGDRVQAGQKMGEIRDLFGNPLKEYFAEGAGVVLMCMTSLAINPGETLFAIGC
jgi:predicted deacylase